MSEVMERFMRYVIPVPESGCWLWQGQWNDAGYGRFVLNGRREMAYEEQYCSKCLHQGKPDGPGCHVWLAHQLYNGESLKKDGTKNPDSILNLLIPESKDGLSNEQCTMYLEDPAWNQETLF